jgi:hypothetical protein
MNSCRFGPKSRNHDPTRWDGWALTSNGWFSAIKLIARISGPGQERSVIASEQRSLDRPLLSETCPMAYFNTSAIPAIRLSARHGLQ